MSDSIFKKIREDHQRIIFLINKIEHCYDIAEKKDFFLKLEAMVLPHLECEQKTLYLRLKNKTKNSLLKTESARETHYEMKALLIELDQIGIENDEWERVFKVFKKTVIRHFDQEKDLFEEIKGDLTNDELIDIAHNFEQFKQQISI